MCLGRAHGPVREDARVFLRRAIVKGELVRGVAAYRGGDPLAPQFLRHLPRDGQGLREFDHGDGSFLEEM